MIKKIRKRDGSLQEFVPNKIQEALLKAFISCGYTRIPKNLSGIIDNIYDAFKHKRIIDIELLQDYISQYLITAGYFEVAKAYIIYKEKRRVIRNYVATKQAFIEKYKKSSNTANATIDDNSNVASKNIGILNAEIHKEDNIQISRGMVMEKLKELYPDFNHKNYIADLESHIIYKHDESSFAGALAPYCCSESMYPFLLNGIRDIGGLSASPRNLDSFCGMYINLIFASSAQFAGAVATSEFLLCFDYFARKEWGNDYYKNLTNEITSSCCNKKKTIVSQIHQYFQQVIYSINQPAAARGMQSAFVNFSIFDKPFFDGMFGDFYFPDMTQPQWESFNWLQKEFLHWFNQERLRVIITFPVVSCTLLFKDGEFVDKEYADFIAQEYSEGNSFFTYISDSVDSLSSCCRLKNKIQTKEFNFTNGNMGVQTGSKSVITLNLNRIIQNFFRKFIHPNDFTTKEINENWKLDDCKSAFKIYLVDILERVYKYHTAYNELLWDTYNADLLPVYKAGFISLNKQYLTIGINGLNEAAEFLGIRCSDNEEYAKMCQFIFSLIKEQNILHKTAKTTYNTECVPAESLGVKNYNWDKEDGYKVPEDRNLYASYIYIPSDSSISVLEKIRMHGSDFIGDYLDGGSAAHINLSEHLSKSQYSRLLLYAGNTGCQYFTFNVPNCECEECHFIAKTPFTVCPKCSSTNVSLWDRIIGYLTKIKNWSLARQKEQKTRVYSNEVR